MTTIAFKDGVVAADTGLTAGGARLGYVTKIVRRELDVAGASGCASWASAFRKWFLDGEQGDPPPIKQDGQHDAAKGAIFRHDGRINIFESGGSFELTTDMFALGSGGPEARGAMQYGASAEAAVRVAMALDEGTYGNVVVLRVGG